MMANQRQLQNNPRDPVLKDDHFSLRYGNPIKVIHDMPKHPIDTFEPTKEHMPPAISGASLAGSSFHPEEQQQSPKNLGNEPSRRDPTNFAEFFHKGDRVEEIDH